MSHAYHVTVAVLNLALSNQFYEGMFSKLGWKSTFEDNEAKAWSDGQFDYWIVPAATKEPNCHNDGVGFNHLAFRVESKEQVDAFYEWLQSVKAKIDIEPKAYPQYGETYYAVFFFDPDGTRLEVVFN
jgi:catechol 2,3-dioxygenase-like lactoylglutathione lyase family enzyme